MKLKENKFSFRTHCLFLYHKWWSGTIHEVLSILRKKVKNDYVGMKSVAYNYHSDHTITHMCYSEDNPSERFNLITLDTKDLDVEIASSQDLYKNEGNTIPGLMCWANYSHNYWQFYYNYEVTCSLSPYIISLAVHKRNKIVKLGAENRKTDKELTDL